MYFLHKEILVALQTMGQLNLHIIRCSPCYVTFCGHVGYDKSDAESDRKWYLTVRFGLGIGDFLCASRRTVYHSTHTYVVCTFQVVDLAFPCLPGHRTV